MAPPTRAMIDAIAALPKFRVSIWNGTSYDIISNDEIISVSGDIDSNGKENGLSFGDAVVISAQVTFADTVSFTANWQMTLVRIEMTYDIGDWMPVFYGFITGKTRNGREIVIDCAGIDRKIQDVKYYGVVRYRRPVATKTSIAVTEDPTDPFYAAGAINEIFWRAGGRPYEQAASFPSALFYYQCDQSLIQPEWIWFSGENLLEELYMLARAGGGQIYQGTSNVIRYVQPFTLANGSSTYTITDGYYGDLSESQQVADQVGTIRATYTPRYLQGYQTVYEDNTAKLVKNGETQTIEGVTDLPVYVYATQTASQLFTGVDWNADPVTPTLNSITYTAQKITINVTNGGSAPMVINSISVTGRPVVAAEKGYTSYGSTLPERNLEDNPYVQSRQHADMLCRMVYDFYSPIKPVITLGNCGFDPDRYVGETVTLNSAYYTISGLYRIVGISYDLAGISMDLKLVNITNLIKRSDMFIAGNSYSGTDTRKVSY